MRIALIAPPFITVPPQRYGGTELFVAQLAEGLKQRGVDVVVYTNGESRVAVEKRWLYGKAQWPLRGEVYDNLKDMNHSSWAMADAARDCDIIHVQNIPGLTLGRLVRQPVVYTVHHPHLDGLTELYRDFPETNFVTISDYQREREPLPRVRTIHHGVDASLYHFQARKERYLSFIGRIAPMKGTHLAIQVAKRTGIPLKIAGEVQPVFQNYFDTEVKPHLDGRFIQYIGEADLAEKNELLGNSLAMLFPIQWDEPFGLVMVEAMACGTPVIALRAGSVPEIVRDGVSGWVCNTVDEMVERLPDLSLEPAAIRRDAEERFSLDLMTQHYIQLYLELLMERSATGSGRKSPHDTRAIA